MESSLRPISQLLAVWESMTGQKFCHYVIVSPSSRYDDLVELHPLLGISLAIIEIDPKDLEACGPLYSSQPCCEGAGSRRLDSGEWSEADEVAVLVVVLLSALEFCLMSLGTTVLDAIAGIEIGVDAVAGVTTHGLINLLVGVTSWSAMLISWSL